MEGLKIQEIPGKGRSVISTHPLKAGQVILKDSPLLLYSALPSNSYCSHCFRTITHSPPATCPACSVTLTPFCSLNCQSKSSTSSHTPWVCQTLNCIKNSLLSLPEETQVQARFLIAAYNLAIVSPEKFRTLLTLHGDGTVHENAILLHSIVSNFCPPEKGGFSLELTAALLAKDKMNAFGIMENGVGSVRSVRGYGIYGMAALFNHDCLPNACRFDYVDSGDVGNTDIVIRMIHHVPEGREICLSYFPVNLNYPDRQARLKEDYGFVCCCDRCRVEANWSDDEDDDGVDGGEDDVAMEDDDDDGNDEELMEEEGNEDGNGNGNDFPHAYFFLRYMCTQENCGGTLAPLPNQPSSSNSSSKLIMECNVCGSLKDDEQEEA